MTKPLTKSFFFKLPALIGLALLLVFTSPLAMAGARDDAKEIVKEELKNRQEAMDNTFDTLNSRIKALPPRHPKKLGDEGDKLDNKMESAEEAVDDLKKFDVDKKVDKAFEDSGLSIDEATNKVLEDFDELEEKVIKKINAVNRFLIEPDRPGRVPKGDIIRDFIPQIVRLLFQFTSLAIFVAFVVSGVMFITAHDNEEQLTKAKTMLYYALAGFAFVAMAFAIVSAITDIDFFRFTLGE